MVSITARDSGSREPGAISGFNRGIVTQPEKPHVRTVRMFSRLDKNESEWQVSQISLQFLVTHGHFVGSKLKIRCSASIYDIYWQTTEVSTEEDRPRVIHYEPPAATIVGINYLQPPPNFQTGQKKPAGHVGVKGKHRLFRSRSILDQEEAARSQADNRLCQSTEFSVLLNFPQGVYERRLA